MIRRELKADISEEQLDVLRELTRRLESFGYNKNDVIEHALYHGAKVLECVAAGHEARAEAVKRVAKSISANAG